MDAFWLWFEDYWWIAFPVGFAAWGGISALYASSERAAKRRHQRKMESIRVKGEIKAAQIAARSGQQAPTKPLEVASAPAVPPNQLLERLLVEHDEITARWLDYELDVAKLIAFPAMSDGRQPLTAAFLRAKKIADTLRPASATAPVTEREVTEYLDAVGNYAVAFEVAERDARRLRDSTFSDAERKKLDRAKKLLTVAVDESATQAERNLAYKRVREELDGLILLSDAAVEVLEKKVAREIDGGNAS
ncbi:hypothetical protein ACWGJP_04960 [Microbacterium sp. NPDC055903]